MFVRKGKICIHEKWSSLSAKTEKFSISEEKKFGKIDSRYWTFAMKFTNHVCLTLLLIFFHLPYNNNNNRYVARGSFEWLGPDDDPRGWKVWRKLDRGKEGRGRVLRHRLRRLVWGRLEERPGLSCNKHFDLLPNVCKMIIFRVTFYHIWSEQHFLGDFIICKYCLELKNKTTILSLADAHGRYCSQKQILQIQRKKFIDKTVKLFG